MSCPVDPVPTGWRVWRGAVPPQLTDMAITIRDHIRLYEYGAIPAQVPWKASDGSDIVVGTWKNHHVWTYKGGKLIENICIPGVTLVTRPAGALVVTEPPDSIQTPDPNAAMYPAEGIDWLTVGLSAAVGALVVAGFFYVLKHEPKRKRLHA